MQIASPCRADMPEIYGLDSLTAVLSLQTMSNVSRSWSVAHALTGTRNTTVT
jgi:hypothetical protein